MAGILDTISNNDLDWEARDAAYKRKMLEFTPPPPAAEHYVPQPNPIATPEGISSFTDAIMNSLLGSPESVMPRVLNPESPGSGEFTQDLLKESTQNQIKEQFKLVPDKSQRPLRPLSPTEKEEQDKAYIRQSLRDPESVMLFNVARERGSDYIKQNDVVQAYDRMTPLEFIERYGADTYNNMAALGVGGQTIKGYANTKMGYIDTLRDIGVRLTSGATRIVADMAALSIATTGGSRSPIGMMLNAGSEYATGHTVTDLVDELALGVSSGGRTVSDAIVSNLQSEVSRKQEMVGEFQTQADHIDQELAHAKDVREEGETIAAFRHFGRNTLDGAQRLLENPKVALNMIGEAAGSMVVVGPTVRGLNAIGGALEATKLGSKIAPFVPKGTAFGTAVGLQEAAGAFSETALRIKAMDHGDLMQTSEEYRTLIKSGHTEEEAKTKLATAAGMTAAPIAFGTGFVTSKLAPRDFETNLLTRGTGKTLGQRTVDLLKASPREFIEETPQSMGSQFATNVAEQQYVDPNQELLENVGEVGIQGGIAGFGSGGVVKGPGLALRAAGKAAAAPFKYADRKLREAAALGDAKRAASAPESTETLTPLVQTAQQSASRVAQGLRDLAETSRQMEAARQAQTASGQTAPTPGSEAAEAIKAAAEETRPQDIPAVLTTEMKEKLYSYGYSLEFIDTVTPEQAYKILQSRARQEAGETEEITPDTAPVTPAAAAAAPEEIPLNGSVPEAAPGIETPEIDNPQETDDFINRVEQAANLQPDDLNVLPNPLVQKLIDLQGTLKRMPNRFEAMNHLADVVADPNTSEQDKIAVAAFATHIISTNNELFGQELPAFLGNTPQDNPIHENFDNYGKVLSRMGANPKVKTVLDFLQNQATMADQDLSKVNFESPEGKQLLNNIVAVATHAPQRSNEKLLNQLHQADEATSNLTPRQRKIIRGARSMLAADRMFAANNRIPEPGMVEQEAAELDVDLASMSEQDKSAFATAARKRAQQAAARAKAKEAEIPKAPEAGQHSRADWDIGLSTFSSLSDEDKVSLHKIIDDAVEVNGQVTYKNLPSNITNKMDTAQIASLKGLLSNPTLLLDVLKGDTSKRAPAASTAAPTVEGIPLGSPGSTPTGEAPAAPDGIRLVSRQIATDGGAKRHQLSIEQHVAGINQARGPKELKTRLRNLALFALSQRNKLRATQDSIDGKGSKDPANLDHVPYEAFDGKKMQPADGVFTTYFNKKAPKSAELAQQTYAEAVALTQLSNDLINQHPEAGLKPVEGEVSLRLPGSEPQSTRITRGDSTPAPVASTSVPATTSEPTTTVGKKVESPPSPVPGGQAPAATSTTATGAETRAPTGETKPVVESQLSPERIQKLTPERLEKLTNELKDRREEGENFSERNAATLKALEDEAVQRETKKAEESKPSEVKSRITQKQAENMSPEALLKRLVYLENIPRKKRTAEDRATHKVVDEAMAKRGLYAEETSKEVKSRISPEQMVKLDDEGVIKRLEYLENIPKEKRTASDRATHAAVDAEMLKRGLYAEEETETKTEGQSRFTVEELKSAPEWEQDEKLSEAVNEIESKGEKNLTPDDRATIAALENEMAWREDHYVPREEDIDKGEEPDVDEKVEPEVLPKTAKAAIRFEGKTYTGERHADIVEQLIKADPANEAKIKNLDIEDFGQVKNGKYEPMGFNEDVYKNTVLKSAIGQIKAKTAASVTPADADLEAQAAAQSEIDSEEESDVEETPTKTKPKIIKSFGELGEALETKPAEPEVEEDPLELVDTLEVTETPERDIKVVYENLVQPGGKNWFHEALQFSKKVLSRLSLLKRPLVDIYEALGSIENLKKFLADAKIEGYSPNENDLAAHREMLKLGANALRHMNGRLTTALDRVYDGKTILERIQAGINQSIRTRNNRILNLLETNGPKPKYNDQLIQAAMLGAIDWALNIGDRQVPVDVEDVARALGMDQADASKYLDEFKRGLSTEMAVRSLAENIRKFWGLQTNRNTNEDFTKGIPEAVAKEILVGLEHVGLIKTGHVDYKVPELSIDPVTKEQIIKLTHHRNAGRVWFDERPQEIYKLVTSLDRTHSLLRDISLVEFEKEGYSIGKPITDIDNTQLRQPDVELTRQNKKALRHGQQVPHFLDRIMLNLYQSMDEAGYVSQMSGRPYKDGDLEKTHIEMGYNKNDWESIKGRQRGLRNTYRNIQKQVAAMQAYADENGIDITEVPVYYRHHINRLGRPQMDGASNPQTDKTARHTFLTTKSILNLSVPGSAAFQKFLLTIGQGIGLKTERKFRDDIATEVIKETTTPEGEFYPLVQGLKEWLKTDQKNIDAASYRLMQKLGPKKLTDHAFHALVSMAKYQLALDNKEDLTKFVHYNPLEADGKTNGIINALMMAAGRFTPKWLQTVAKGGVFFGRLNKTLNQHYEEDPDDIYQTVINQTAINQKKFGTRLEKQSDKAVFGQFQRFRRFLAALNVEVNFDANGDLVMKRGLAKSSQTKSVYGAGTDSLARTVTHDLIDVIYEALSEEIQTDIRAGDLLYGKGGASTFAEDLRALVSHIPYYDDIETKEWQLSRGQTQLNDLTDNQADFTLSDKQFDNLKLNVKAFLIGPMQKAIKDTVNDHTKETTEAVQRATQIQSIFIRNMFINEVIHSMAEKKANPEENDWAPGEISLSENDMTRIRKLMHKFSPFIDTGTQRYMMTGGESTNLFDKITIEVNGQPVEVKLPEAYSTTLDRKLKTAVYIYGYVYAGVRAIPTLNVGSGDGQMMLNMLADHPEEMKRMLHVFDGLYMPADAIEEFSRMVNEEVYNTWTKNKNPVRAVAESFAAFMRENPVDSLFPGMVLGAHQREALFELSKVAYGAEPKEMLNSGSALVVMKGVLNTLNNVADKLDRRRQVYSEFDVSIDHMSSAGAPFVHIGSIKLRADATYEELSDAMNARMDELETQDKKKDETTAPTRTNRATQTVETVMAAFLRQHALVDEESGAQIVNIRQLRKLPEQAEIMTSTINYLAKQNYLIVYGTRDQLEKWTENNQPDSYKPGMHATHNGMTSPGTGTIWIVSDFSKVARAQETLTHELIHGATYKKVWLYFNGGKDRESLSVYDQAAIDAIENLMNEWLDIRGAIEDPAHRDIDLDARAAIVEYKFDGNMAGAVNEFMAYVLAHQELATAASKVEIKNPLSRIIQKTLDKIKSLIWGKNLPTAGNDILSNLRFNTEILLATPTPVEKLKQTSSQALLFQSPAFGNNDRLTTVRDGINNKIIAHLQEPYIGPLPRGTTQIHRDLESQQQQQRRERELHGAAAIANNFMNEFSLHFPDLGNMQGHSTFKMLQAVMFTDLKLNPNSMARLQELYDHAINHIKVKDFRTNEDPNDQNDITQAQNKFEALHGLKIFHTDAYGRSSFMSSFLALAMTSDTFRNVLEKIPKPEAEKNTAGGFDALVENTANAMMDRTSLALSGERSDSKNVRDAVDDLMVKMLESVTDQQNYIDTRVENWFSGADRYTADKIQALSAAAYAASDRAVATSTSPIVRGGARLVRLAATIINEQEAENAQATLLKNINKVPGLNEFRALMVDWIGRTKENANVWDLISKVKAIAHQTRQRYRTRLPKEIAKKFSRTLRPEEWTALFKGFGKSDLPSLINRFGAEGSIELSTDDRARQREIAALERSIQSYEGPRAAMVIQKAKQHANFMLTGVHGVGWLRNAHAIAHLYDQREYQRTLANPQLESDVDTLVTLYSLDHVSAEDKAMIHDLAQNEKDLDGLKYVYHYMAALRKAELAKVQGRLGTPNYVKGHIPSLRRNEGSLIIRNNTEHAELLKTGYTKVADYNGSSADRTMHNKSYYFSPVSGTSPFRQGIMQTVHYTSSGINPATGYLTDEVTAGRIEDQQTIDQIRRQVGRQRQTTENLSAVFDQNTGEVIAYERLADVTRTVGLDRDTNLAKMIGAWKGRQVEESFAPILNEELVNELKRDWDKAVVEGSQAEFTNVMVTTDPVLKDAVDLIPNYTRDYITQVFGQNTFMVRRSLELQALGDRQASVGDFFTGKTRWKKPVQERFERLALGLFATRPFVRLMGDNKAYTSLVHSEKFIHDFVTSAKNTIVIRSVIVPTANILSGMGQLMNRGVPARDIIRKFPKKVSEINTYIKLRDKEIKLEADLVAAQGERRDPEIRKLTSRIQAIKDSYTHLSIYPLIQGGQFASISNGQVTAEDLALGENRWADFVETQINKLPDNGIRTLAKYVTVARDTTPFRILSASVQYGDLIMKAILYDDMMNRQQMANKEAVAAVSEAFINYNVLPGRGRDALERAGLLWFYNYKIRSMKEAAILLRRHPLRSLFMMFAPGVSSIDSPVDSNLLSLFMSGDLGWSIGPGMGFNAWTLNPVVNIID